MLLPKRCIFFVILLCNALHSQAQDDYRIYHRWINNAERCFFLEGKTDSAYQYYDMAFAKFDFVFAKDCFMAAQIAYYNKSGKYADYLRKGFKNGLRSEQLKSSKILASLATDSVVFKKKFQDYKELRKLELKKMIQHVAQDQSEKNMPYSDNDYQNEYEYYHKLQVHINFIEALIKQVGFPGDKLIGIDQDNIMKELGRDSSDYIDLYDQIYKDPKYRVSKMQFTTCNDCIAQTMIFPLLVHHVCIYQLFANYWQKLIISGQIHPREVALLYDNSLLLYDLPKSEENRGSKIANAFSCNYTKPFGCYYINPLVYYKNINCDRAVIDSMRTALYINTIQVDSFKQIFSDKYGFKTSFGFFDCR